MRSTGSRSVRRATSERRFSIPSAPARWGGPTIPTAGDVGAVDGGVVANVKSGELEYLTGGVVDDGLYTGSATVAEVYCTTCHAVTDANDPHRTGLPWTPGSFPFVVPVGTDAGAFLERSAAVGVVTGTSAGDMGPANTCVWCHKSRVDVTQYVTPTGNTLSTYWGPHEGPQADVFSAAGGYEYGGRTYGTSTHQLKLSCVDCHMAPVTENENVPDHSFNPSLSVCLNCHAGATSFNVNGGQDLNTTQMLEFEADLGTAGLITDLAVFQVDKTKTPHLTLIDHAPDVTVDEIRAQTEAEFEVA